jgi:hypothetical protein
VDNLDKVIDSIWGSTAHERADFAKVVTDCLELAYGISFVELTRAFQNVRVNYDKQYGNIKNSGNRKVVLAKVEKLMTLLRERVASATNTVPADLQQKVSTVSRAYQKKLSEICALVGEKYEAPELPADGFGEITYTKQQLSDLYALLLAAYEKYKLCVRENNMFAAFPTYSDFGLLKYPDFYEDSDENTKKDKLPSYQSVVDALTEQNAIKYAGMLDEDFVPHVDAFWSGLQYLCEFLDNRIKYDDKSIRNRLDEALKRKLLRKVSSSAFVIDTAKWETAESLRQRYIDEAIEKKDGERME